MHSANASQPAVVVSEVTKRFGSAAAVDGLSFEARPGEILGFLGPNGAGKTTTMRMILDILRPDSGRISVLGERPGYRLGRRIGYLPEERGLYRDVPIGETLAYLAALHGIPMAEARRRAHARLEDVGLGDAIHKKASELSRGMHQKAQVLATMLHDPELVILDEPFQGLDPINADMLRALVVQQRERGASIVLSTHRMEEAEELCDRIVLIARGRRRLYGRLDEIRDAFGERDVVVHGRELPLVVPGATGTPATGDTVRYELQADVDPGDLFRSLAATPASVDRFEVVTPSLEEIFVRAVGETPGQEAAA